MRDTSFDGNMFESCYLLGYALLLARSFIYTTAMDAIFPGIVARMMRVAGYLLLVIGLIRNKRVPSYMYLVGSFMVLLSLAVRQASSYINVLDYAMCAVCAMQIPFNKIVKTYGSISIFLLFLTVLLALMGVIDNYIYYREGAIRLSMGFVYTTDFVAHVFFIAAALTYLFFDILKLWHLSVYLAAAYLMYELTNSRAPSSMILFLFFVAYLGKLWFRGKRRSNSFHIGIVSAPAICAGFTFLVVKLYNPFNQAWRDIDRFASQRLSLGQRMMSEHRVTMLGQYIQQKGDGHGIIARGMDYTYIDLSFMRILLLYGAIFFVFLILYSIAINILSLRAGNYVVPLLLLVVSIYSIGAQHYFDFSYNFLLLGLFADLSDYKFKASYQSDALAVGQDNRFKSHSLV